MADPCNLILDAIPLTQCSLAAVVLRCIVEWLHYEVSYISSLQIQLFVRPVLVTSLPGGEDSNPIVNKRKQKGSMADMDAEIWKHVKGIENYYRNIRCISSSRAHTRPSYSDRAYVRTKVSCVR